VNDILIVSDMADLRATRHDNREKFDPMEFMFSSRDPHKLHGWVPENIYVTERARTNMDLGMEALINLRKVQGSKICPVS